MLRQSGKEAPAASEREDQRGYCDQQGHRHQPRGRQQVGRIL